MFRIFFLLFFVLTAVTGCKERLQEPRNHDIPAQFTQHIVHQLPERKFSYLERELIYLMKIWPGEYDNVEQLDFDKMANTARKEAVSHDRVHRYVHRLDLPGFGDYVLYEEEYMKDDPTNISRQVIYRLKAEKDAEGIEMDVFHVKSHQPYLSLNKKLPFSKNLSSQSPLLEQGLYITSSKRRDGL